jgi:hypothetical protein
VRDADYQGVAQFVGEDAPDRVATVVLQLAHCADAKR